MSREVDLATASREQLLTLIAEQQMLLGQLEATIAEQQGTMTEQQAVIGQLQQRIAGLEARLAGRNSGGPPGNKPTQTKPKPEKKARKRRPKGFARCRLTPTERVEHAVESCPECGTRLFGGWVQRTREVIELPVEPVRVIEHVYVARICPVCQKRRVPAADLGGEVVGQQRLGVNLVSLIVTLREVGRLPFGVIQWYLETFHQLTLSVGGIVEVLHQVAQRGEPTVQQIQEQIRGSPVVHADETGWRQDGQNGYVWTYSTRTERYFLRRGRNKEVVDEVLGERFGGVLVTDFYAAYDHYPGLHQRCWAHLLRDIHDLKAAYPEDADLATWAKDVHDLYEEAKAFEGADRRTRRRAQLQFERRLLTLSRPFADDPLAVQGRLCRRIQRFIKELFVFVVEPAVPADNNAAERSLRPLVTSRKISGGTRSPEGTTTKMRLASLFGTWHARGLNPFLACRQFLISPQF